MDDLLADFLTETNESLGELDTALVKLERNPDDRDTLSLIFRLVHTVKGTCGFLGLPRLEKVAHAAENVLGKLRDNQLQVSPEIISQVLAAIDRIKEIVAGPRRHRQRSPPGDDRAADRGARTSWRRARRRLPPRQRPSPRPHLRRPNPSPSSRPRRLRSRSPSPSPSAPPSRRPPRRPPSPQPRRPSPARPSASASTCWKTS